MAKKILPPDTKVIPLFGVRSNAKGKKEAFISLQISPMYPNSETTHLSFESKVVELYVKPISKTMYSQIDKVLTELKEEYRKNKYKKHLEQELAKHHKKGFASKTRPRKKMMNNTVKKVA